MYALDDVRVLDFGQYVAGPFGPMILADLGADVIKVEPVRGDGMRLVGKPYFGSQRGKRDIALDLKDPRGHELALALVATADVVHHNMTRGTATRLRLDYEACRAVREDVIYCNCYAYGPEGPLSHLGGLDPLFQASSGLEYDAGATHAGNMPLYYRFGMCDTGNAMLSVVGVLLALAHRDRTGEGQELWTSLLDAGTLFASDALIVDGAPIERPRLDPGLHGLSAGYRLYETADGWIQVAAIGAEPMAALRECTHAADDDGLEDAFRTRTSQQWRSTLDEAGVPNEIPYDPDAGFGALSDPVNVALGVATELEHPTMGTVRQHGTLVELSETPGRVQGPPPLVGQHTQEILTELGLGVADQEELREAGVVTWPGDDYEERYGEW